MSRKAAFRVGQGYDVHRFSDDPQRACVLGGVRIEGARGLEGHSDADVLAHAVADALFGALGEPDIGFWFPPGDADCKDMDSLQIVAKAAQRAQELGFFVGNVDAMLIAEVPKVGPYVARMKENLAAALGVEAADVGVKATTNERMGFVGREEGIAAMAVATVQRL